MLYFSYSAHLRLIDSRKNIGRTGQSMAESETHLDLSTHSEDIEQVDGYDDPFATIRWPRWLEMQAQTLQRFSRFERAIARREPKLAMLIAVEMQEMALEWQKEVCEWTNRKYSQ
jgi:hypothetical protein